MLNDLLGGQQRQDYDDFVRRYDQGAPWDGIGDDEALDRYRQVAPNLSEDQYRDSAREAFSRLSPQQRAEFGHWLQQHSRSQNSPFDMSDPRGYEDPDVLAGYSARMQQQQPGLLEGLLGGGMGMGSQGGGSMLSGPIGKAVLGGIAAMAASKVMGRR